jgi:glyoxylase-like metal-dependent hydrolase (beta-lactamase superfamily II)
MNTRYKEDIDFNKPVNIGNRAYWIGAFLENDPFQCHPYIIENGDESILIDPGSMIEKDRIIDNIRKVSDLKNIKYIILHHQDPDLCASVPHLEELIDRDDLLIVTHSRMSVLIKHYGLKSDYYNIDENDLKLTAKDINLEFHTTPYCHSPGAFVTYCRTAKILFSGDLFGGLEQSWHFYADENYYREVEGFHMAYMPSRDILNYALRKIEALDIELIAPQHGSLIKREYISPLIEQMKLMKSGLYIDSHYTENLSLTIDELNRTQDELNSSYQETEALKKQQDGDYYLFSLLLKPLMPDFNKSDKVSTNFVVYQKKKVRFKKKLHQIGGDMCTTGNLNFNGKPHTVFFNSDGMGKSMQGAAGSLVMGTIMNTIMNRTSGVNNVLTITPEEWMKNTYNEIQSAFLAFDGAMIISGMLGLIDDNTGKMIYFNTEHPQTVLYRNGKADFLEKEIKLHKFGVPEDDELELEYFQLEPGDVLFITSDGRDEINLTPGEETKTRLNDETHFLKIIENSKGDLEKTITSVFQVGELLDDFSILRVGYNETVYYTYDNTLLEQKMNGMLIDSFFKNHKYKDALELLEEPPEKQNPKLLFYRGYCHAQYNRYNKALEYMELALEKDPDNFQILKYAGYYHYLLKNYDTSIKYWDKAHSLKPDDTEIVKNLKMLKNRIKSQTQLM